MVKKKSGRTLNPADAHRKAMRQKEIKKNKAERKRVRTLVMVHKDTSKLEEEIARYKALDKEKRLDKNGKAKLKDLQDKLSKILETKKAHGINIQKYVFRIDEIFLKLIISSFPPPNNNREKENQSKKEHTPIFFHPTLNPLGLPPPGASQSQPKSEDAEDGDEDSESTSDDDDDDEKSDASKSEEEVKARKEESDQDIPLPPGSPPTNELSDELPELPPGPPPQKGDNSDDDDSDDLPALPPGLPPTPSRVNNGSPFGYGPPGTTTLPPGPPPFGTPFTNPFATYSGPPGSTRPSMRPPPPPPFPGQVVNPFALRPSPPSQGFPSHPQVNNTPPPVSRSLFSHYGPQAPGAAATGSRPFTTPTTSPQVDLSSPSKTGLPSKPTSATPVIQAEPQVRNLQKELTTLVPITLLRKKAAAAKPRVSRPVVNAAPNIDDGLENTPSVPKRTASTAMPVLPQPKTTPPEESQDQQKSAAVAPPAKKAKTKKYDEYEKFMSEMQDLL